MARGGSRAGSGRKPDPNSARQKALAKRAAKTAAGSAAAPMDLGRGMTLPSGEKAPHAPADWPFGTAPVASAPAPAAPPAEPKRQTAKEFLSDQVNNSNLDIKLRMEAAKRLIEFEEAKPAPVGVKAARQAAAQKAAGAPVSKFAAAVPPRLVAAGGKKV